MLDRFEEVTGGGLGQAFMVINYQYGEDFSGPGKLAASAHSLTIFDLDPCLCGLDPCSFDLEGKDVFRLDRAVGEPSNAHNSNFLHPVIYYFERQSFTDHLSQHHRELSLWNVDQKVSLFKKSAQKVHHMLEDFLAFWNEPTGHQLHLRRFLESILGTNLKRFTRHQCLAFHASFGNFPPSCGAYFDENEP